jgi:hypothetical protein
MKSNPFALPKGCALVDSLSFKLAKSNKLGFLEEKKFLDLARKAILGLQLTSREPVTGFPITDQRKVSPIVLVEDFINWLKSWQCQYADKLKRPFSDVSTIVNPLATEAKPKIDQDLESANKKSNQAVKKSHLISLYGSSWPTLSQDIKKAGENGLREYAKAGKRDWHLDKVLEWGNSRKKFRQPLSNSMVPINTMANLPSRQIKGV